MGLMARLGGWLAPRLNEMERTAIERVVDHVDPRLRLVSGYERKLASAVRGAMSYCHGLVAAIPGPVDINVHAFGADPLVHALFATPGDIGRMLATSREVRNYLARDSGQADEFFAMVGMRRKEKTVAGLEMTGELIRQGTPRRLLYFADHTVHVPSADIETARNGLCEGTLESLAKSFAAHLADLRHARDDLRGAWEQERALAKSDGRHDVDGMHAHRLLGLEHAMRDAAKDLEPGRVLNAFIAWLGAPEPRLHLEKTSVAVDPLGVIAEPDHDGANVRTLNFPELIGRDRRRWIVLLARISRDDALRAQQESDAEANRYLII